jgi:hypothetical protein
VRSCVHQEAAVEINKERGILKTNKTTYQFNPLPVEDNIPSSILEVYIAGNYKIRLGKALRRADESFNNISVGEITREYNRAGNYKIAEVLHRRAIVTREDLITSYNLSTNLQN